MNNKIVEGLKKANYPSPSYRSLYTIFSSTGKRCQSFGYRACFGNVLKYTYGAMHNTYTIYTFIERDSSANNHCIFTPEEIRNYLKYISDVVPFTFEVSEETQLTEEDKTQHRENVLRHPYIKIFVDIDGPHINHVFILTFIRYLYEEPYKYVLADVFRLKEIPEFSKLSLFNLYNAVAFSILPSTYSMGFSSDMSHYPAYKPVLFLRKENIKERMAFLTKNAEDSERTCVASICDIFPVNNLFKSPSKNSPECWKSKEDIYKEYGFKFVKADKDHNMCKEFLEDSYWQQRLEIYRNNILLLIDATDEEIKANIENYNLSLTTFTRYGC